MALKSHKETITNEIQYFALANYNSNDGRIWLHHAYHEYYMKGNSCIQLLIKRPFRIAHLISISSGTQINTSLPSLVSLARSLELYDYDKILVYGSTCCIHFIAKWSK